MAKALILLFIFLLQPLKGYSSSSPYLISGFDDVLRQAENTGLIKAGLKLLEKDQGFTGMPELYEALTKNESNSKKFSMVSAISLFFKKRIDTFLDTENYPKHETHLRSWLTEWSIEKFKTKKIDKIIKNHPKREFIIIFDNSNKSIELTNSLSKKHPLKIKTIYLRQVEKKTFPKKATPFYTAFDIALNEYKLSRLSEKDFIHIGNTILKEKNLNNIIPDFANCPKKSTLSSCKEKSNTATNTCLKVKKHIKNLCSVSRKI